MKEYEAFWDGIRYSLANKKKPKRITIEILCNGDTQHPLMWLIPSPDGLVPVPCSFSKGTSLDVWLTEGSPAHPRTINDWESDERLPIGQCTCGDFQGPLLSHVKDWMAEELKYVRLDRDGTRFA